MNQLENSQNNINKYQQMQSQMSNSFASPDIKQQTYTKEPLDEIQNPNLEYIYNQSSDNVDNSFSVNFTISEHLQNDKNQQYMTLEELNKSLLNSQNKNYESIKNKSSNLYSSFTVNNLQKLQSNSSASSQQQVQLQQQFLSKIPMKQSLNQISIHSSPVKSPEKLQKRIFDNIFIQQKNSDNKNNSNIKKNESVIQQKNSQYSVQQTKKPSIVIQKCYQQEQQNINIKDNVIKEQIQQQEFNIKLNKTDQLPTEINQPNSSNNENINNTLQKLDQQIQAIFSNSPCNQQSNNENDQQQYQNDSQTIPNSQFSSEKTEFDSKQSDQNQQHLITEINSIVEKIFQNRINTSAKKNNDNNNQINESQHQESEVNESKSTNKIINQNYLQLMEQLQNTESKTNDSFVSFNIENSQNQIKPTEINDHKTNNIQSENSKQESLLNLSELEKQNNNINNQSFQGQINNISIDNQKQNKSVNDNSCVDHSQQQEEIAKNLQNININLNLEELLKSAQQLDNNKQQKNSPQNNDSNIIQQQQDQQQNCSSMEIPKQNQSQSSSIQYQDNLKNEKIRQLTDIVNKLKNTSLNNSFQQQSERQPQFLQMQENPQLQQQIHIIEQDSQLQNSIHFQNQSQQDKSPQGSFTRSFLNNQSELEGQKGVYLSQDLKDENERSYFKELDSIIKRYERSDNSMVTGNEPSINNNANNMSNCTKDSSFIMQNQYQDPKYNNKYKRNQRSDSNKLFNNLYQDAIRRKEQQEIRQQLKQEEDRQKEIEEIQIYQQSNKQKKQSLQQQKQSYNRLMNSKSPSYISQNKVIQIPHYQQQQQQSQQQLNNQTKQSQKPQFNVPKTRSMTFQQISEMPKTQKNINKSPMNLNKKGNNKNSQKNILQQKKDLNANNRSVSPLSSLQKSTKQSHSKLNFYTPNKQVKYKSLKPSASFQNLQQQKRQKSINNDQDKENIGCSDVQLQQQNIIQQADIQINNQIDYSNNKSLKKQQLSSQSKKSMQFTSSVAKLQGKVQSYNKTKQIYGSNNKSQASLSIQQKQQQSSQQQQQSQQQYNNPSRSKYLNYMLSSGQDTSITPKKFSQGQQSQNITPKRLFTSKNNQNIDYNKKKNANQKNSSIVNNNNDDDNDNILQANEIILNNSQEFNLENEKQSAYIDYQKEKKSSVVKSGYVEYKPKNIYSQQQLSQQFNKNKQKKSQQQQQQNSNTNISSKQNKFSESELFFQKQKESLYQSLNQKPQNNDNISYSSNLLNSINTNDIQEQQQQESSVNFSQNNSREESTRNSSQMSIVNQSNNIQQQQQQYQNSNNNNNNNQNIDMNDFMGFVQNNQELMEIMIEQYKKQKQDNYSNSGMNNSNCTDDKHHIQNNEQTIDSSDQLEGH